MAEIRLLLDEDVHLLLAQTLRRCVFEAQHVVELKRTGLSDPEQLAFAVTEARAYPTHNIRDYVLLDREYRTDGKSHFGILVCDQVSFSELLRRTLRCLDRRSIRDGHVTIEQALAEESEAAA